MRYTKQIAALGCVLSVAFAHQGLAADKPSFIHDGVLKVCTAGDFPPMGYYENPGDKKMTGYEIDVVDALAKQWDATTEYIVGDFKGLLPSLQAERCGLVASGILVLPQRLQVYDAISHFKTSLVIVTAASTTDIKTPADLSGKVIAIEGGTNYEKIAAEMNAKFKSDGKPEMTSQTYPGASAVIQQILVGRAAATITQDTTAAFRSKQVPGRLAVPYTYPDSETYGFYIRKNPEDLQALKAGFVQLKTSGTVAKLLEKWNLPASAADVQ